LTTCELYRYSPTHGHGSIGHNDIQRITRLCLSLDKHISRTNSKEVPARKRNSHRRAQARLRQRIRNLVDECHKKAALWFLRTFDVVIIPEFNGGAMSRRKGRKIGSKTVRQMLTWSHSRFRQRLTFKAEELGKKVVFVSEAWTSKTCSWCGWVDTKLGGKDMFRCRGCGLVIDRDVNGARGIFLLDGAILL